MASLRQYTNETVIAQIADILSTDISDKLINRAESMIDSYCGDFYEGSFVRAFNQSTSIEAANTTFTDTTLTVSPNPGNSDNYYTYTVIELMEGNKKGLIIPVLSSNNNQLSFATVAGLSGQIACRIYQLGKFPMYKDTYPRKSIPREIIEAVAYQVDFLFKNAKKINQNSKKSESIGENYSYTNEDLSADTLAKRIAPMARDILDNAGYSAQTK